MYEARRVSFEANGKDRPYRIPKSHETVDEVLRQMARDGWRLVAAVAPVYGQAPDLTLFWEREA